MVKLAVNIDGFVALRKMGGAPKLVDFAQALVKGGVKALISHAHDGCRCLDDKDIAGLKRHVKAPLWLEMPPSAASLVFKAAPSGVCLVSEKTGRVSSLDLTKTQTAKETSLAVQALKKKGVKVSILLDCQAFPIRLAKKFGVHAVVLWTGSRVANSGRGRDEEALEDMQIAARLVHELGLELQIGQNLQPHQIKALAEIPGATLLNLGSSVAAQSALRGLADTLEELRESLDPEDALDAFAALKALS